VGAIAMPGTASFDTLRSTLAVLLEPHVGRASGPSTSTRGPGRTAPTSDHAFVAT
jgi:hypothetical protein